MSDTNNTADSFSVNSWAVLDALPGGLAVLDAAGIIRYTNTAWERVLSQNGLSIIRATDHRSRESK